MSGPKCNTYTLADEERERQKRLYQERLERQRRERIRQEKLLKERLEKEREEKRVKEFDNEVDNTLNELAILRRKQEEKEHNKEVMRLMDEFLEVYGEYTTAAIVAGEDAKEFEFDETRVKADISEMKRLTEEINAKALEDICRQEVNRIVNETIEDMGYQVLGEKNPGAKANAVLYRYDDSTAINVINTGNTFVMEVVATDNEDRLPTQGEKKDLYRKMENFCGDYEDIMERLENDERLKINRVYHMPADEKYAHVINTSAYSKEKTGIAKKMKTTSSAKKKTLRSNA